MSFGSQIFTAITPIGHQKTEYKEKRHPQGSPGRKHINPKKWRWLRGDWL